MYVRGLWHTRGSVSHPSRPLHIGSRGSGANGLLRLHPLRMMAGAIGPFLPSQPLAPAALLFRLAGLTNDHTHAPPSS